jgi:hypothetical protein
VFKKNKRFFFKNNNSGLNATLVHRNISSQILIGKT